MCDDEEDCRECVDGVGNHPFREKSLLSQANAPNQEPASSSEQTTGRPLYAYCTQYQKHYANVADELERYGFFKKSKAHVAKLNALNPEPVVGITSMSKNPINGVETIVRVGRGFNMTLDAHSFELVRQKTSLSTDDFYNHPEKVTDVYYAEMVKCSRDHTIIKFHIERKKPDASCTVSDCWIVHLAGQENEKMTQVSGEQFIE